MVNTGGRSLKTIERTIQLVEHLQQNGASRITEIADDRDMSPATVYNHLSTLEQHRFVVKEGEQYRLGLRFLNVGGFVRSENEAYNLARRKVKQLAETTDERAQLVVEEEGRAIVLCSETSENAVMANTFVGKVSYIHASAAGKAMLSKLPDSRVSEILDRWGLPEITENTIVDEATLFEELEEVRERGFAFNEEESIEGLRAVGVPIVGPTGRVLGALSISGPTHRMKGDRYRHEIPNLLLGEANEIELNVKYGAD